MTAMGNGLATWDGEASPELIRFYEDRAKGGCGLIFTEFTRVDENSGACNPNQLCIATRKHVRSVQRMAECVHRHMGDACRQNGLGARGLLAVVTARLQGHIQGGASGILGTGGQGVSLCVGLTAALVPALADDAAVLDDHSPHHGIGRRPATAPLGQLQRQMHELLVLHAITSKLAVSEAGKISLGDPVWADSFPLLAH